MTAATLAASHTASLQDRALALQHGFDPTADSPLSDLGRAIILNIQQLDFPNAPAGPTKTGLPRPGPAGASKQILIGIAIAGFIAIVGLFMPGNPPPDPAIAQSQAAILELEARLEMLETRANPEPLELP